MRSDFFIHEKALVYYFIFGDYQKGYSAKADVSFLKSFPAKYIPIHLERVYATKEEAEGAIIDFCKTFIDESLIEMSSTQTPEETEA